MKKASKASHYNLYYYFKTGNGTCKHKGFFLLKQTNTVSNTTNERIIRLKEKKTHKIGKNALEYLILVNTNHIHV